MPREAPRRYIVRMTDHVKKLPSRAPSILDCNNMDCTCQAKSLSTYEIKMSAVLACFPAFHFHLLECSKVCYVFASAASRRLSQLIL